MTSSGARARTLWLIVLGSGFVLAARAPAAGPVPGALDALQPGLWEVAIDGAPPRAMCLADPIALTQVRHGAAVCSRMVIAGDRTSATVHYSCPNAGWGRTEVRVETPRVVRIDSQGIAGGAPFAFTAQARRTGDCGGGGGMQRAAVVR